MENIKSDVFNNIKFEDKYVKYDYNLIIHYDEYIDYNGKELKYDCEEDLKIGSENFPETLEFIEQAIAENK